MLFLRILDEREEREAEQTKPVRANYRTSLKYPYRWRMAVSIVIMILLIREIIVECKQAVESRERS